MISEKKCEKKVSFEKDILPVFQNYTQNMAWRFDLTSYEQVRANHEAIYSRISLKGMPPPPFKPLSDEQIHMFYCWVEQGFPP